MGCARDARVVITAPEQLAEIAAALTATYGKQPDNSERKLGPPNLVLTILEDEEPAADLPPEQLERYAADLEEKMREAARRFEFEKAAELRDRLKSLKTRMLCQPTPAAEAGS